ncbi:hypothetical protein A0J51_02540 [Gluconobacter japonicus]|nr:hypothetical protein A0J51_02540 [Gluconobacter japonicus]
MRGTRRLLLCFAQNPSVRFPPIAACETPRRRPNTVIRNRPFSVNIYTPPLTEILSRKHASVPEWRSLLSGNICFPTGGRTMLMRHCVKMFALNGCFFGHGIWPPAWHPAASFERVSRISASRKEHSEANVSTTAREIFHLYLWKTNADAEAFYIKQWWTVLMEKYQTELSLMYSESPIVVDNVTRSC